MKKISVLVVAFLVFCGMLVFAGGKKEQQTTAPAAEKAAVAKQKEAPMLAELVAKGELPPLEERLPEEPLVVVPVEEIGQYGGTWRIATDSASRTFSMTAKRQMENLVAWSYDFKEIVPNIAKGWEISEDKRTTTFFLRKGMKWSDGAPFTADDFVFCWNDIRLNREIYPVVPSNYQIAGEPGEMVKTDDYTFSITFAKPYGMFVERLITIHSRLYAPMHFLTQYHPKYTSKDEIEKMMKEDGHTSWSDFLASKWGIFRIGSFDNPGAPNISPWIPETSSDQLIFNHVRNPYYWKIDTEGNQLPYIDRVQNETQKPTESILLQAIAGDLDFEGQPFRLNDHYYVVLMQNRQKGDYRFAYCPPAGTNHGFYFNFWHKDPFVRELFRDKRFRVALSHAINREEINQLVFEGMGVLGQSFPPPGLPWHNEELTKVYAEHDVEKANSLLDELGLKWDANREYRLRPNGEPLKFQVLARKWQTLPETAEIVMEYWKKVGMDVVVRPTGNRLMIPKVNTGDFDIAAYNINKGRWGVPPVEQTSQVFPLDKSGWNFEWVNWFNSDGKEGEEPPPDVKRLREIHEEAITTFDAKKRLDLEMEALKIHAENLWDIGTVGGSPKLLFYIAKNNFRNVPERMSARHFSEVSPQFFFKN